MPRLSSILDFWGHMKLSAACLYYRMFYCKVLPLTNFWWAEWMNEWASRGVFKLNTRVRWGRRCVWRWGLLGRLMRLHASYHPSLTLGSRRVPGGRVFTSSVSWLSCVVAFGRRSVVSVLAWTLSWRQACCVTWLAGVSTCYQLPVLLWSVAFWAVCQVAGRLLPVLPSAFLRGPCISPLPLRGEGCIVLRWLLGQILWFCLQGVCVVAWLVFLGLLFGCPCNIWSPPPCTAGF